MLISGETKDMNGSRARNTGSGELDGQWNGSIIIELGDLLTSACDQDLGFDGLSNKGFSICYLVTAFAHIDSLVMSADDEESADV